MKTSRKTESSTQFSISDEQLLSLPREGLELLVSRANRILLQHQFANGKVLQLISEHFKIGVADLLTSSSSADWIVGPRFAAMVLLKEFHPEISDQRIADVFKMDRSSVRYARRVINSERSKQFKLGLKSQVDELRYRLNLTTK